MKLSLKTYFGTAALWVAIGLPGCTVETTTSGLGSTGNGTTGSAGSTSSPTTSSTTSTSSSGSAGSGGSAGATTSGAGGSATGGSGGSGGSDGDASLDTGPIVDAAPDTSPLACFAEDGAGADAGTSCSTLPYYTTTCSDAADDWTFGRLICDDLEGDLKVVAFREIFDCLKAVPGADGGGDPCSAAHDAAVEQCSKNIFNRSTCAVPDGNVDGGAYGCAQVAASCPSDGGTGGITVAQCQAWLAPFNALARQGVIECYLDPATPAGTSCADKFENECVFPPL